MVRTNLQAGKVRLVFVADDIPAELRRVVEFLNTQMSPAEVLAVEVKQFVGQGLKTLVPRVVGQTAEAQRSKPSLFRVVSNEATVFEALQETAAGEEVTAFRRLYDFAKQTGSGFNWGTGVYPSVSARFVVGAKPVSVQSCYAQPSGATLEIGFRNMIASVPTDLLAQFADGLREIPGVPPRFMGLEHAGYNKGPSLPFSLLAQPGAADTINNAITALMEEARIGLSGGRPSDSTVE